MSKLETNTIDTVSGTTNLTIGGANNTGSTTIKSNNTAAITVDSSQNVGIGTTSPASDVHISNGGSADIKIDAGANQCQILMTNAGATDYRIRSDNSPDGLILGTSSIDAMTIDSSGDVMIGTTTPTGKLNVLGRVHVGTNTNGTESSPYFTLNGSGYTGFHWLDGTAYYIGQNSNSRRIRIYSGSNETAGAQLSAGATSFSTYSDERLKKDITDLTNGLDKISAIRPVKFKFKTDTDDNKTRIGVIAQSLVGQVDEALDLSRLNDTDTTEYYDVRYQDLIPVLVKGMQEQQTQIEELKARIQTLENA